MAVFSKLSLFRHAFRPQKSQIRWGGHGRVLNIVCSPWTFKKVIDDIIYYWCLAAIPLFMITTYSNIVIGPAELRDIPEGYEPKIWEYERHPLQRWFMKHMYPDPRFIYELKVAYANLDVEKLFVEKHENWIKDLMLRTADSSSWFYGAFDGGAFRIARKNTDDYTMVDVTGAPAMYNQKGIRYDTPQYAPYFFDPTANRNRRFRFFERAVDPYSGSEGYHMKQNTAPYAEKVFEVPK